MWHLLAGSSAALKTTGYAAAWGRPGRSTFRDCSTALGISDPSAVIEVEPDAVDGTGHISRSFGVDPLDLICVIALPIPGKLNRQRCECSERRVVGEVGHRRGIGQVHSDEARRLAKRYVARRLIRHAPGALSQPSSSSGRLHRTPRGCRHRAMRAVAQQRPLELHLARKLVCRSVVKQGGQKAKLKGASSFPVGKHRLPIDRREIYCCIDSVRCIERSGEEESHGRWWHRH